MSEELVLERAPRSLGASATVHPTAPGRYRVQFTASAALRDKLERLQALMPQHDLVDAIEFAVTLTLPRLEARRFGAVRARRKVESRDATSCSRHVPAAVRRAVWERDRGRCRYVDERGQRCEARRRLELHHRRPFGHGGAPTVDNICLMCRTHNRHLAEIDYGKGHINRSIGRKRRVVAGVVNR